MAKVSDAGKRGIVGAIVVMTGISMISLGGLFGPPKITPEAQQQNRLDIACLNGHEDAAKHEHQKLTIIMDGEEQEVEANIGIEPGCMREVHTHDASGEIHVETLNAGKEITLGEFFNVWGYYFNRYTLLGTQVDAEHVITMMVNGERSDAFGDLVLEDGQDIVINYLSIVDEVPTAPPIEVQLDDASTETEDEAP